MSKKFNKYFIILVLLNFYIIANLFGQENSLLISSSDIKIIEDKNLTTNETLGYHLFIKKKQGIQSVMLTETTKDPLGKEPNYAYRAKEFNEINGNEIRILNGEQLNSSQAKYFLIATNTEKNEFFNECFHIYIPTEIEYGYSWSRSGSIKIGKGTFINIRSFEKKYCDYSGKYFDNPYMFDFSVVKKPKSQKKNASIQIQPKEEIILTDDYNPLAAHAFEEISDFMIYSKGPETIIDDVMNSIMKINPKDKADVVFAIDATGSMKDDIQRLKEKWIPRLLEGLKEFNNVRLGLVFYRDYVDNFNTNGLPVKFYDFTDDVQKFVKNVRSLKIVGTEGGDIPEAVYEALFAAVDFYNWRSDAAKKIILIGDAQPHPVPRRSGKYSKSLIENLSKSKNIEINAIITPDEKSKRGR